MYHTTRWQNLTTDQFQEQMRILHELGFRTLTFHGLRWYLEQGIVPRGRVIITFDDVANYAGGHAKEYLRGPFGDFWLNAFPTLQRYGFTAVLGVVTGLMPEEGEGWDWKKLRFLSGLSYELASHSVTHTYKMIGRPAWLTREEFGTEFSASRNKIEQQCGIAPITYIWPFGSVRYKDVAAQLYPVLVTEAEGGPITGAAQLQRVPRYHPDLHMGDGFRQLMLPFREPGRSAARAR